ncbi:MAG: hypothetical protein HC808_14975 [Candidatus Competibacteraceae bacterium]|nr:hypothetical protein [Candidatus Competibacteraceae bacterium]
MKRRLFFSAGPGLLFALSAFSPLQSLVIPQANAGIPLGESFSYAHFKAYLGEMFSVYGGQGLREVVALRLIAVDDHKLDPQTEQFTVYFKGPYANLLEKGVYTFENARAGKFQLFIESATGNGQKNRYYRSIFNLLR